MRVSQVRAVVEHGKTMLRKLIKRTNHQVSRGARRPGSSVPEGDAAVGQIQTYTAKDTRSGCRTAAL
jgi:hypothetical protein